MAIDDNLGQTRYSIAPGPDENSSVSAFAFFTLQQLLQLPSAFADADLIQSAIICHQISIKRQLTSFLVGRILNIFNLPSIPSI